MYPHRDFGRPTVGVRGFEYGLEAVRSTPIPVLVRDVRRLAASRAAHPLLRGLAAGEPEALNALANAMRALHRAAIAPYERGMSAAVERDRAVRITAMAGGVEELLRSLQPTATWSGGELAIRGHPDQEIPPGGRGLLLVPS